MGYSIYSDLGYRITYVRKQDLTWRKLRRLVAYIRHVGMGITIIAE